MIELSKRELKLRYDKPWKIIFYFCAPTVLLMVVQGLYNILDKTLALTFVPETIASLEQYVKWYNEIKGTSVSRIPLEDIRSYINVATQYTSQIMNFIFAFAVMIGFGCTLAFSIAYGQRDVKKMAKVAGNGFSTTIVFSIFVSIFVMLLVHPKLNSVMITSQMGEFYNPITLDLAWKYVWLLISGAPLLFLSYYFISLLRAEGYMLLIIGLMVGSILSNIGFSILFITVGKMSLTGAALGSFMAWIIQIAGAMIFVFSKRTKSFMKFSLSDLLKVQRKMFFIL